MPRSAKICEGLAPLASTLRTNTPDAPLDLGAACTLVRGTIGGNSYPNSLAARRRYRTLALDIFRADVAIIEPDPTAPYTDLRDLILSFGWRFPTALGADFNGDGLPDILDKTTDSYRNAVRLIVLFNQADGYSAEVFVRSGLGSGLVLGHSNGAGSGPGDDFIARGGAAIVVNTRVQLRAIDAFPGNYILHHHYSLPDLSIGPVAIDGINFFTLNTTFFQHANSTPNVAAWGDHFVAGVPVSYGYSWITERALEYAAAVIVSHPITQGPRRVDSLVSIFQDGEIFLPLYPRTANAVPIVNAQFPNRLPGSPDGMRIRIKAFGNHVPNFFTDFHLPAPALVVAEEYGLGRIVHFAHPRLATGALLQNAIEWATRGEWP